MSDNGNNKQLNGSCISADSNFASATTCLEFYNRTLEALKENKLTTSVFSLLNNSAFEANVMPINLHNLSGIESKYTKRRDNFATERAVYEATDYALKQLPRNDYEDKHKVYYDKFFKNYENEVKNYFDKCSQGKGRTLHKSENANPIKILSQESYAKLNEELVSFLLKNKPDGTKNLVRRIKVDPESISIDENGNETFSYYTKEQIAQHEQKLFSDINSELKIESIDVSYCSVIGTDIVMQLASLASTDSKVHTNVFNLDEFKSSINLTTEECRKFFDKLVERAESDLPKLEKIVELQSNGNRSIRNLINKNDENVVDPLFEKSLNIYDRYITYLSYMKYLLLLIEPIFHFIHQVMDAKYPLNKNTFDELLGRSNFNDEDEDDINNYNQFLRKQLSSFEEHLDSDKFIYFTIPNKLVKFLMHQLLSQILLQVFDKKQHEIFMSSFYNAIPYDSENAINFSSVFSKKTESKSSLIFREDMDFGFIRAAVTGKSEIPVNYILRSLDKYFDENGFTNAASLIETTCQFEIYRNSNQRSKKQPSTFEIKDEIGFRFIFDVQLLLDTVLKIVNVTTTTMSFEPYKNYTAISTEIKKNIDKATAEISKSVDEKFGQRFNRYYIPLPPIPYDNNEKVWAKRKCEDLKDSIKKIWSDIKIQVKNEDEFKKELKKNFREALRERDLAATIFNESNFEDPTMIENIKSTERTFKTACEILNNDESRLQKLILLEQNLYKYENLDTFQFVFNPFKLKFNPNIGTEMDFVITNCQLLFDSSTIPINVSSIVASPDGEQRVADYFKPFFEPFSKINKSSFSVVVSKEKIKDKNGIIEKIMLKVTFGSSIDLYECSKFRTRFFTIQNYKKLFEATNTILGTSIPINEMSLNKVPKQLIVKWSRTFEQIGVTQGDDKSKTFKFYDESRGCDEKYPFYDTYGTDFIADKFWESEKAYRRFLNLAEIQIIERERREEEKILYEKRKKEKAEKIAEQIKNGEAPVQEDFPSLIEENEVIRKTSNWNAVNKNLFDNMVSSIDKVSVSKSTTNNISQLRRNIQTIDNQNKSQLNNSSYNHFDALSRRHNNYRNNENITASLPRGTKNYNSYNRNRAVKNYGKTEEEIQNDENDKNKWTVVSHYHGKRIQGKKSNTPQKHNSTNSIDKRHGTPAHLRKHANNRSESTQRSTDTRNITPQRGHFNSGSKGNTPNSYSSHQRNNYAASPSGFMSKSAGGQSAKSPSYYEPEVPSVFNNVSSPAAQQSNFFSHKITPSPSNVTTPLTVEDKSKNDNVEEVFSDNEDEWEG